MNGTGKGTILVVDDHHSSLKLLSDILEAEGYEVRPADGGEIALASAAANPPDLVLLDMLMPDMDGLEVFRRMQSEPKTQDVPVIFATASTDLGRRVEGLKLGAADYITKPFERTELLARVAVQIKLHRLFELSDVQAVSENAQADAAMELLGCENESDVYEVIGDFMRRLVPDAVTVVNSAAADENWLVTRRVVGLDESMLSRAAALLGFEIIGKQWPLDAEYRTALLKGTLSRFPGGLEELASVELPSILSGTVAKAFGLHDVFSIGIADRERVLGTIQILTRTPDATLPIHLIESFARHCFSALTGISKARDQVETAERHGLLLSSMVEGLALHETVLDDSGVPCDYRFVDVNPAYEEMTGLLAEEIVGHLASEVVPSIGPDVIARYGAVALTGIAARFVDYSPETDRHFEVVAYRPQPGRFATVVSDVTEQNRAGAALQESERWLSESQRIAELGHYIYDIEADRWYGSPALNGVLGVSEGHADDFEGWLAIVHPDHRDKLSHYFTEEVLGQRQPFDAEYRIVRATDGAERWVHGLGTVDFSDDGRPLAMFGIIQDVTQRKEAAVELERREARLEELLKERELNLAKLEASLSSIIEVVGTVVETRDPYTAGHQLRVSELAVRISEELGMSAAQIEEIRVAALLHDVGKISVPAEILSRPGKLSDVEFELIKGHAEAGFKIISSAHMEGPTAEIIYQHHERCDGSGYPQGLRGDQLLEGAQVLMVADVVEAMSSHRPYRAALGTAPALAEIDRGAGWLYDAKVSAACKRVIEGGFEFSAG